MARIVYHESIEMNGKRIPANGTKGNVFAYEEYISGETIFILCAERIEWRHLKVSPNDLKLGTGTFEVDGCVEKLSLNRADDGWPSPQELSDLRDELKLKGVILYLSRKPRV